MARIRKIIIHNTPQHITQRGVRSINIFFKDEDFFSFPSIGTRKAWK